MNFRDDNDESKYESLIGQNIARSKNTCGKISGDSVFKATVVVLLSLIFVFQLANLGVGSLAGYEYKNFIRPKLDKIWLDYMNISTEYYKLLPQIQNATSYILEGETVIDEMYGLVGQLIPSMDGLLSEFNTLTNVFVPYQMSFAQNQTLFTTNLQSCAHKYKICNF